MLAFAFVILCSVGAILPHRCSGSPTAYKDFAEFPSTRVLRHLFSDVHHSQRHHLIAIQKFLRPVVPLKLRVFLVIAMRLFHRILLGIQDNLRLCGRDEVNAQLVA